MHDRLARSELRFADTPVEGALPRQLNSRAARYAGQLVFRCLQTPEPMRTRTSAKERIPECENNPFTPSTQDILPAAIAAFPFLRDTTAAVVSRKNGNAATAAGKMSCVRRGKALCKAPS
jgi:hypothetical protein